jgi:cytoskeleton protein RodZ
VAKLAPTQVEQLRAIGAHLSQVRRDQELSIDAVANQIFIRPTLLKALESGNDAELPEPVFVQGFIRRYAEALGLDGKAISQDFQVTPVDVLPDPNLLENAAVDGVVEPEVRHSIKVLEKAEPVAAPTAAVITTRRSPWPIIAAIAGGALLLGLVLWAIFGGNKQPTTVDTPSDSAVTTPEPSPEEPADGDTMTDPAAELPETTASPALEAPIVVAISLSERSWLSVTADGANVFEGTPEAGFEETWTAEDTLVFTTGNAGGVEMSVNGADATVLGDSGTVRTVTLTPDSDADTLE